MNTFLMKYYWILISIVVCFIFFVRLFALTTSPPALYWEEVALGYDAYSILKTGKDHHGNALPIFAFESFGDWKPSGYFYALVPFIATLGLNEWAVRLPAALSGIALVFATAYLGKKLKLPFLLTLSIAALSPWGIHFSRSGWEVMLATALLTWGIVFLWDAFTTDKVLLKKGIVGTLLIGLSAYTYHATRIIGPILFISVIMQWLVPQIFSNNKYFTNIQTVFSNNIKSLVSIFATVVLLFGPLFLALATTPELKQRYNETGNIFDESIVLESNELREREGNSLLSRIFYHRYIIWGQHTVLQLSSHLTADYLITTGDENLRHGTKFFGIIYPTDSVFLLLGLLFLGARRRKADLVILFWLFLTLLVAALAKPVPHALRTLPALPAFILIIASGIWWVFSYISVLLTKKKRLFAGISMLVLCIYAFQFVAFWKYYLMVYPHTASNDWQYGYKEVMQELGKLQTTLPESTKIFITREKGRPAMYYWFFTQTNPRLVQAENQIAEKDQGEYTTYKTMSFEKSINEVPEEPLLLVASKEQTERYLQRASAKGLQATSLYTVLDLNDKPVWIITQVR